MKLLSILLSLTVVQSAYSMWADPYLFTLAGQLYLQRLIEDNTQPEITPDGKPKRIEHNQQAPVNLGYLQD